MNRLLSIVILLTSNIISIAQNSYTQATQQGDAAFKKGEYKKAINKYFAAEAFEPGRKEEVRKKVNQVFDTIQSLRKRAELAEGQANNALKAIEIEKNTIRQMLQDIEEVNSKNERILNAIYFYNNRFALARSGDRYYYINREGEDVSKLGVWIEAEQFNNNGFANVKKIEGDRLISIWLDTLGNTLRIVNDEEEFLEDTSYYLFKHSTYVGLCPPNCDYYNDTIPKMPIRVLMLENPSERLSSQQLFSAPNLDKIRLLKLLTLSRFRIETLPSAIHLLQNLEELNLPTNQLDSLPTEIELLKQLKKINLNHNRFDSFPSILLNMPWLQELKLGYNRLANIPEKIVVLEDLRQLDLSGNLLETLPLQLFNLKELTLLNLSSNRLAILPSVVSQLSEIEALFLDSNQLKSLPKEICELKKLQQLTLAYNQLTYLPENLNTLNELKMLSLEFNRIAVLPLSVYKLKNLKVLYLRGNPISVSEREAIKKRLPTCRVYF